jgi:uracil-DNA glycosylase family 4
MGFFHTTAPPAPKARTTLNKRVPIKHIPSNVSGCTHCTLDKADLRTPKQFAAEHTKPDVYVLGDAPTLRDDKNGALFSDTAGQIIVKALRGIKARYHNVLRCSPGPRDPSTLEIKCCRGFIETDIAMSKPKLILLLGSVPLHWMTGESNATAWRNRYIPVNVAGHKCYAMPLFSPGVVLSLADKREGPEMHQILLRDIDNVLNLLKAGVFDVTPMVLTAKDLDIRHTSYMQQNIHALSKPVFAALEEALAEALTWDEMSLDIETTGLRPYAKDSRILSISISNYDKTYALGYQHSQINWGKDMLRVRAAVRAFLIKSKKKWAHNLGFELEWLGMEFGPEVLWDTEWGDTMAQAYTLDERRGALSLGSLCLQYLGYNIKLLSTVDVKKLDSEPLDQVLLYKAHDAKYTYLVRMYQAERLEALGREHVVELVTRRIPALAAMQIKGVMPNFEEVDRLRHYCASKLNKIEESIEQDKDWLAFRKKMRVAAPTSNDDVLAFFKDYLGRSEINVGNKKAPKYSTDQGVLETIKHPMAKHILELRNANKMLSTYVKPYIKGTGKHVWPDDMIHAQFNLMLTTTGRLSCEEPNLQNFPKRKGKEIRKVVRAPENMWMVSVDYGQIEARVIGMASKDKVLCDALWTGYDIHMVWAKLLAEAYPDRVGGEDYLEDAAAMKEFRGDVKNQWTFPLFFGSALDSVCRNLQMPKDVVKPLFTKFWDTFAGVKAWQDRVLSGYEENGYVEMLTGRRRHGPLSGNESINTPIQGTASDIVTEGMVILSRIAHEEGLPDLQPCINIHDDLTFYLPDLLLDAHIERIAKEMCSVRFPFINVPITVEVSVGKTWDAQEEIGVFSSTDFGHKREAATRQVKTLRSR